jgi:hypothetical protein
MYGVFATFVQPPIGKVGLGYAMAMANIYPSATVLFPSFQGKGPIPMMQLIRNMLDYNPHNRPSAIDVQHLLNTHKSILDTSAQQVAFHPTFLPSW